MTLDVLILLCRLRFLIYAYIIHIHELGKNSCRIRITWPSAANRDIHNDEERMIEDPLIGYLGRRQFEVFLFIE